MIRGCSVPTCDRAHYGKGFCRLHLDRVRAWGVPILPRPEKDMDWMPAVGHEATYEVSEFGDVRSLTTGKVLRGKANGPYRAVELDRVECLVHRIVALTYVGEPTGPLVALLHGTQGPGTRARALCREGHNFTTLASGKRRCLTCRRNHEREYRRLYGRSDRGTLIPKEQRR
jgi:hypothetical protein